MGIALIQSTAVPLVKALLLLACVLALSAAAIYVARSFRGSAGQSDPQASDMLTKFRELHAKGVLSAEEYRTIRTKLARQLQEELKDIDETG
jgi:uncharacterized membrane protein